MKGEFLFRRDTNLAVSEKKQVKVGELWDGHDAAADLGVMDDDPL